MAVGIGVRVGGGVLVAVGVDVATTPLIAPQPDMGSKRSERIKMNTKKREFFIFVSPLWLSSVVDKVII